MKDKKILVTGGHGFVGKNLILELQNRGCKNILNPTRQELDLRVETEVKKYFEDNKPEIVIHLAGKVGGILINKEKPGDFFFDNIMMGTLVTHYSYLNGVEKLVSLAAGCGYPKHLKVPFTEVGFWEGLPDENSQGYSMAKKNLIIQSWAYRKQFGFNSTVLLPANIYGPHDNFNLHSSHVVPALIRKFIEAGERNEDEVVVWGSGKATREFLYVDDTVNTILQMININETGPFNLGTGVETSVKELAEILKEATEFKGKIVWDVNKPDGQPRRFYDMTKLKEAVGEIPSTSVKDGIIKTIEWYKKK